MSGDILKYVPVFIFVALVFLLIGGQISLISFIMSIVIGTLLTMIFTRYLINKPGKLTDLRRVGYFSAYLSYYLFIAVPKAHLRLIKTILIGKPLLRPCIVKVRFRSTSMYGIATSANSITNTPGTVVIDVDESENIFYVHWLYCHTTDEDKAYQVILKPFESMILKIFE